MKKMSRVSYRPQFFGFRLKPLKSFFILLFFVSIILSCLLFPDIYAENLADVARKDYFTVQAASFSNTEKVRAVEAAQILMDAGLGNVRVEEISGVLALRVGFFTEEVRANTVLGKVREVYPGALLRKSYYVPERVLFPQFAGTEIINGHSAEPVVASRFIDEYWPEGKIVSGGFERRTVYSLPVFEQGKTITFPVNTHSLWFELPRGMGFTSPFYLHLDYSYSETLIPGDGSITLLLNDNPVASRRFPGTSALSSKWTVNLPRRFLKEGFNELRIVSRHRSSRELCADSENSSNWLRWESGSYMSITRQALNKLPLFLYPFPYLDRLSSSPVNCEWLIRRGFSDEDFSLLLFLASEWGYKNPVVPLDIKVRAVPEKEDPIGNRIFFLGVEDGCPDESVGKGFISNSVFESDGKMCASLNLSGDNASGFRKAVGALASGMTDSSVFDSMEVAFVPERSLPEKKGPYEKAYFYEMGISDIVLSGAFQQKASFILNRPVLSSLGRTSHIMLRFNHSEALNFERSVLSVSVNGIYSGSFRFKEDSVKEGFLVVKIPLNQLGKNAWLVELDVYHDIGNVDCGKKHEEIAWTVIKDSSYLRFSSGRVIGYPYLEYFPFASRSPARAPLKLNMWLPEEPSDIQLTSAALIAARAGQVNRSSIEWNVFRGNNPGALFRQGAVIIVSGMEALGNLPEEFLSSLHFVPLKNSYRINEMSLPLNYSPFDCEVILQATVSPWNSKYPAYSLIGEEAGLRIFNSIITDRKKTVDFSGGVLIVNSRGEISSFPIVDEQTVWSEIESERNRYVLPMVLIASILILFVILLIALLIRVLRRPRNRKNVAKQGVENKAKMKES